MITADALTKRFGDHLAVTDMTFTAPAGNVTGFLGPNGAGKSTTFRMLLGLARPTSGTSAIEGVPYHRLHRPRERVGAVLESSGFHPSRTGRNHLKAIAVGAGLPASRIGEVLQLVGLSPAADKRVGGYSMGMRQRLALAGALLGDPHVLILDEPMNGLDPQGVTWLRTLLRMWADEGRTVLVSSHLLAEVAQVVDHVVIISDGRVVHEGAAESIRLSSGYQVRCADPVRLAARLEPLGASTETHGTDRLTVTGATSEEIGRAAAHTGVAIFELTASSATTSLEALFLQLTTEEQVA